MSIRNLALNLFTAWALLFGTTALAQKSEADDGYNVQRITLLPDNPDKGLVDDEVKSLIARYKKSGFATADVAAPVQLKTDVLSRLFPNHRFYLIGWDEHPIKGKNVSSLGFGLYYNFVVGPDNETTKLRGSGDFAEFGQFLSKNNIKIKNSEDARAVWLAFCVINQKHWHSREFKQISPTEWHLGLHDYPMAREHHYFWFQVHLDDNQTVTSAKLMLRSVVK